MADLAACTAPASVFSLLQSLQSKDGNSSTSQKSLLPAENVRMRGQVIAEQIAN